ncbi:FG-GAP repeat domain-containing protein [Arundinibacter roseus]|uniref:VCBS repeat-containing protein n=1 Tax=Arundinibacter roseus TaxID=2070510 RepID=A0A4R4K7Q6_9BACT|nr:VCBS repeat-containing protein [Arundinibacter roseus]TDB63608.1 VCBS repeat-containing protein [Arundinibacter roseus]
MRRFRTIWSSATLFLMGLLVYWSCGESRKPNGEVLARQHCSGCHAFPEPELLDKKTWKNGVLPYMAPRLGLSVAGSDSSIFQNYEEQKRIMELGIFPESPVVSQAEWESIVAYYLQKAPDSLLRPAPQDTLLPLPNFTPKHPKDPIAATVTSVRYDQFTRQIWVSQRPGGVFIMNRNLQIVDSLFNPESPFSDFRSVSGESWDLLSMGMMDPNDDSKGALLSIKKENGNWRGKRLINKLQRPVHATWADVNEDGYEDVIVCEYGNYTGKLAWYQGSATDSMPQRMIENSPGARMTYWKDYDGDGRKDLWVLWAQGDEQISVYLNGGKGNFAKKVLLRFPPTYGSGSFELHDFNGDGKLDILYANGDNGDKSYLLKPYHGIRIFMNKGKDKFEETFFYPLDGATQALARDFDGDGDLDIAAIAFFPDFSLSPVRSFVYLENKGNNTFLPRTFAETNRGRWLTMEAADIDEDGDLDLLLGSFYLAITPTAKEDLERWKTGNKGVLILENKLR